MDISFENMTEKEFQTVTITNFRELLRLQSEDCAKGEKFDRKTSGCKWTDGRFSKYKDWFETKSDLELTPLYSKTAARIRDALVEKAKCVDCGFTGSSDIPDILSKPKYESKVRYLFINDLLAKFLNKHNLCLQPEELLQTEGLPTSRADYVIFTKTNEILGCVEAKKRGKVDKNSSVQCTLQLLSLHTRAKNSLFGILTDGYSFKFMKLDANRIFHFATETPIRIENEAAFHKAMGVINRLIHDEVNEVCIGITSLENSNHPLEQELRQKLEGLKYVRAEIRSDIHDLKEEMKGATKEEKKSLRKQIVELKVNSNSLFICAMMSCQWAVEMFIKSTLHLCTNCH